MSEGRAQTKPTPRLPTALHLAAGGDFITGALITVDGGRQIVQ